MNDLDLRKLRYFRAVATHLHFGRAAAELHIAQPVLTRQIRAFEQELGVQLFERSRRGTTLTPQGQTLLEEADTVLRTVSATLRRLRLSTRTQQTLTLGFMPGIILTPVVRALTKRFPEVQVEVLRTSWDDQVETVLDGRVDASFVRLPIVESGLRVVPLFEEPRVVIVPVGHPLAAVDTVTLAELAELELLQDPRAVPEWRDAAAALRGSAAVDRGAQAQTVEEKLELVASERGIVVLPASTASFYTRPDLTYRPVADIVPGRVALAFEATRHTPVLTAVEEVARDLLG